jgi:AraC-like DNA-binding protein
MNCTFVELQQSGNKISTKCVLGILMNYVQYAPPTALQQFVRYFWSFDSLHSSVTRLHIKSFADRYPRFIFQDLNNFSSLCKPNGTKMPVCYLSGLDTKPTEGVMGGTFSHFGVSFYPHALNAFFQIDADKLIDETPDIRLICNSDIYRKLEQAGSHLARVQIVSRYLYDKIYYGKTKDPLINYIIQRNEIHETMNVYELIHKYKISERQLERKFKTAIGIAPKKLQRIVRFEKSLSLLGDAEYSQLTAIAHSLNYTDQPHFIKDFKAFSGMTPYEFVKDPNFGSESSSFIYNNEAVVR